MFKPQILTILITMLLAASPAMAENEDERNKRFSEQYKENIEANREAKNSPHPAHEMGAHEMGEGDVFNDKDKPCKDRNKSKSSDKSDKDLSQEYKENLESNRDAKNMPHPAHEMGEGDPIEQQ